MGAGLSQEAFQDRLPADLADRSAAEWARDQLLPAGPAAAAAAGAATAAQLAASAAAADPAAPRRADHTCACAVGAVGATGAADEVAAQAGDGRLATLAAEQALFDDRVSAAAVRAYPTMSALAGGAPVPASELAGLLAGLADGAACGSLPPAHGAGVPSAEVRADRPRVRCGPAAADGGRLCSEAPAAVLAAPLPDGLLCEPRDLLLRVGGANPFGAVPVWGCGRDAPAAAAALGRAEADRTAAGLAHGRCAPPTAGGAVWSGCYTDELCPLGGWRACAEAECAALGGPAAAGAAALDLRDGARSLRCGGGASRALDAGPGGAPGALGTVRVRDRFGVEKTVYPGVYGHLDLLGLNDTITAVTSDAGCHVRLHDHGSGGGGVATLLNGTAGEKTFLAAATGWGGETFTARKATSMVVVCGGGALPEPSCTWPGRGAAGAADCCSGQLSGGLCQ